MSILQPKKLQARIFLGYSVPIALLVLFAGVIGLNVKMQHDITDNRARANHVMEGSQNVML